MSMLPLVFRAFCRMRTSRAFYARRGRFLSSCHAGLILGVIAAIALVSEGARSQWIRTGGAPPSPKCIVADQGNLYAGTWGSGVYKSTDGGETWTAVNNGLTDWHTTGFVYSLASVPASSGNGTILYAGMEGGGIWRSTDEGASWVWVYPGAGNGGLNVFALGSAGSAIVAGARQQGPQDGVYRSDDDGQTWTRGNAGFSTAADSEIRCFTSIRSGGTTYLYVGTDDGLFSSTSGGAGWTRISSGLPADTWVLSVVAVPGAGGVGITLLADMWFKGIYRSTDNGSSWSLACNGFLWQGVAFTPVNHVEAFATSPAPGVAASTVFAAAWPSVIVSTDGGIQWWETFWPTGTASEADGLCINGGTLYAFSSVGQVWKYPASPDSGWVVQPSGTIDSLLAVKAVDNSVAWTGGTNGGVFRTTNGGGTWTSVGGGAIGSAAVSAIEALDANTALVTVFTGSDGRIYRTTNGGSLWSSVASEGGIALGGIQMKSALEGYAVGTPVAGKWTVLKTTDGGGTWNSLPTAPAEDSLSAIGMASAGPFFMRPRGVQLLGSTLWFGSPSGVVFRSTDLGATWSTGTDSKDLMALHFNTPTVGVAGCGYAGSTYSTGNGGLTWDSAGAASTRPITCISGSGSEFWATMARSIAYSNSNGTTWSFFSPGYWGLLSNLNAVSFSKVGSSLNGWAVGDSGMILHYQRGAAASVSIAGQAVPARCLLEQNYPNPFNPSTSIGYQVAVPGDVKLMVYDLLGREVGVLVNERKAPGSYSIRFDGTNLASGVYFYRLSAGEFVATKRLLLLK